MFTAAVRSAAPARRILAVLVLALVALLALPGGQLAAAHDELIASTPTDGERFDTAPTEASLTFSAEALDIGTELALLRDDTGELVEFPAPFTVSGTTLTQPLPELAEGSYSLNWRVVSVDGHPISGAIRFGVGVDAGTGPVAVPTATSNGGIQAAMGELPSWFGIAIGIAAVLAAVLGAVTLLRLRGRQAPGGTTRSDESE